jgi:glutaredoxin
MTTESARITLLVQENCGLCEHAKDVLARVAEDFPIQTEEVHLGSDRGRQLAQRGGVMFAPGVFVDDEMFGFGRLSEKKLRRTLQRRPRDATAADRP